MATEAIHFRRLVMTESQQQKLMIECRKRSFDITTKSGYFIQQPDFQGEMPVRLVHSKLVSAKALVLDDTREEYLDFEKLEWQVSSATDIVFDFNNGLVYVKGAKSGFQYLISSLEEMKINFVIEEMLPDLKEVLDGYKKSYTKSMIKSVAVKNYVADHQMKISGTFKATKISDSLEFIEENSGSITKWQIQTEHTGEKFKVTVTDKADVSISGEMTEGLVQFIGKLFVEHNQAAVITVTAEETEPHLVLVTSTVPLPAPAPVPQAATVG